MMDSRLWVTMVTVLMLLPIGCTSAPTQTSNTPTTTAESPELNPQAQQTIRIVGAATPYPAMKLLASAYEKQASDTKIDFLESSQTAGGIAGVKEKLVDIGTVTREPKAEEVADELTYRKLAQDALLVATNPSVEGVSNLTTEDLRAIYSGQATNWQEFGGPDAAIVVLDRPEDESAKWLLRKYYLGPDLTISPDAIVLRDESDLAEATQTTPYAIGAFSLSKAISNNLPVNRIILDGVAPTPENLREGNYSMARTLGIVWYGTPSETTQEFIDFIFSEAGADVLLKAGFAPIK